MDDAAPMNTFPVPSFPVEADRMAAYAQGGLVQWPLVMTRLAQASMSAGFAQAALAQRTWMGAVSGWPSLAGAATPKDPENHVLNGVRIRCETSLSGMRRINDDWLACSFECVETLLKSIYPPDFMDGRIMDGPAPAREAAAPRGKPRAVA